jgi:hypothetical protein
LTTSHTQCFLATFDPGPCDGRLVRAHLLPKRIIKREFKADFPHFLGSLEELMWHPDAWRPACGGITGIGGHHGKFDVARTLKVPRWAIPEETETMALMMDAALGREVFGVFLDREYGPRHG